MNTSTDTHTPSIAKSAGSTERSRMQACMQGTCGAVRIAHIRRRRVGHAPLVHHLERLRRCQALKDAPNDTVTHKISHTHNHTRTHANTETQLRPRNLPQGTWCGRCGRRQDTMTRPGHTAGTGCATAPVARGEGGWVGHFGIHHHTATCTDASPLWRASTHTRQALTCLRVEESAGGFPVAAPDRQASLGHSCGGERGRERQRERESKQLYRSNSDDVKHTQTHTQTQTWIRTQWSYRGRARSRAADTRAKKPACA
jgi:hypothetical protein